MSIVALVETVFVVKVRNKEESWFEMREFNKWRFSIGYSKVVWLTTKMSIFE